MFSLTKPGFMLKIIRALFSSTKPGSISLTTQPKIPNFPISPTPKLNLNFHFPLKTQFHFSISLPNLDYTPFNPKIRSHLILISSPPKPDLFAPALTSCFDCDYLGYYSKVFTKTSAAKWPLSGLGVDGYEGSKNRQAAEIQKSIGVGRQGSSHYSMAAYPMQQSPYSMQLINDAKQAVPISMNNPFFRGQFGGPPIKQQGLSVQSIGSFLAGTTEPWYGTKASCAPAQLTIFYGGMVNVYDDISPEKAQAIMFLAGNGASSSTPRVQPQTPVPRTPVGDVVYNAQPINVGSALSSPMSVSSHPVGQPMGGPTNRDDGAKTVGGSSTPITKLDTPRVINSLEQVMQSGIEESHMTRPTRQATRGSRTTPTPPAGTSTAPTHTRASARTGPPNEHKVFTPCNCVCSSYHSLTT